MSEGRPTKLVRDGGTEAYDPPPDLPLPDALVPVTPDSGAPADPSDLRRYGDTGDEPYSARRAKQAGFDAISGGAILDEPGGDW